MNAAFAQGLPEWFNALMYSPWLYAAAAGVFFVVFVCGLAALLVGRKKKTPVSASAGSKADVVSECCTLLSGQAKINGQARIILLAAGSLRDLPVTVSVNVAVRLANSHQCLLIDLDTKRDAVAHVFEVHGTDASALPVKTPVKNLSVWPAHCVSTLSPAKWEQMLAEARRTYDIVLFNAPYLNRLEQSEQIVRCTDAAVVFSADTPSAQSLCRLLSAGSCRVHKMRS
ncbi:MAG TPA: hypothetical protein ENN97_06840 [Phycisphaerales bacterium]|nr:hypothetical protein [Phycisphaerales bacterium]